MLRLIFRNQSISDVHSSAWSVSKFSFFNFMLNQPPLYLTISIRTVVFGFAELGGLNHANVTYRQFSKTSFVRLSSFFHFLTEWMQQVASCSSSIPKRKARSWSPWMTSLLNSSAPSAPADLESLCLKAKLRQTNQRAVQYIARAKRLIVQLHHLSWTGNLIRSLSSNSAGLFIFQQAIL